MNTNQNPEITLTLLLSEVNNILSTLQELPAKIANPLTDKITMQGKAQLNITEPSEPAEVSVKE